MLRSCLVGVIAVSGCGGGDSGTSPAPADGPVDGVFPATVGPRGGALVGADGSGFEGVRLELPEGALAAGTQLDLVGSLTDVPLPSDGSRFVGVHVGFSTDGLALAKPARLRVPLSPAVVDDFDQTPADCKVWLRTADSWEQVQPVESDETSVTIELTSLRTAAAGIVLKAPRPLPTEPFPIDCVPGQGLCVRETGGALEAGAQPQTLSDVVDGKFHYLRQVGTSSFTVVEHDSDTGATTRQSQAIGGAPSGAVDVFRQRVSRAPDGSVWAGIGGFGAVQFTFTGLPTAFLRTARVHHVVHHDDGTQRRVAVSSARRNLDGIVRNVYSVFVQDVAGRMAPNPVGGGLVPTSTIRATGDTVVALGADQRLLGFLDTTPFTVTAPPSFEHAQPPHTAFEGGGDCLATGPGGVIAWCSSKGSIAVAPGGGATIGFSPTEVEVDSNGIVYAFLRTRAEVYRFDPKTDGLQTIVLSTAERTTPEYRDRIPQAIRRLPGGALLVVVGTRAPSVIQITPSP